MSFISTKRPVSPIASWSFVLLIISLNAFAGQLTVAQERAEKSNAQQPDWEKQVIDGLATADLAETLSTILKTVVEEGVPVTQRRLANCQKTCTDQYGPNHLKTKSLQIGIDFVRELAALKDDSLQLLLQASEQSAKGHDLLLKGKPMSALAPIGSALAIRKKVFGGSGIIVALSHAKLAVAHSMLTDFIAANHHFSIANRMWKELAFAVHPFNSVLISNQAYVATKLGLDEERLQLLRQAQTIAVETTGKKSLDYLYPSVGIAACLFELEQFEEAFSLIKSLESVMESEAKSETNLMLIFKRLIASRHFLVADTEQTERSVEDLIKFSNENLSTQFSESVRALTAIIFILVSQKRKEKAMEVLKGIEAHVKNQRSYTAEIGDTLGRLGLLNFHIGDTSKAYSYLKQAVDISIKFMESRQFTTLEQRAQGNFKLATAWLFNSYFHAAIINEVDAKEISDVALYWKGSITLNQSDRLRRKVTTDQLTKELPAGSAFINFIEFSKTSRLSKKVSFHFEPTLLAIIIEPGKKPRYCELCKTEKVHTLVGQWVKGTGYSNATAEQQLEAVRATAELKKLVWDPLQLELVKESLVFISPDSLLGRFSFDALPSNDRGRFLIEDYRILNIPVPRLSGTRPTNRRPKIKRELLAFGDIDYGRSTRTDRQAVSGVDTERNYLNGGTKELGRLAHSKSEIESVEKLFPENLRKVEQGKAATEESFRSLASSSQYLLISSHASCNWMAIPKPVASKTATFAQTLMSNLDIKSGIAFANANIALESNQEEFTELQDDSDGFLYSSEIEELDLTNVEVAMLSACSTGKGAPTGGEGVISLSRSFQIAGAKHSVATFWDVDDQATSKITKKFFELIKRDKLAPVDAIRQAKLWAINNRKTVVFIDAPRVNLTNEHRSNRLSPYYWAPFTISGNLPLSEGTKKER